MRRCGVLAELDPAVLCRLPEVRDVAPIVRSFQRLRLCVIDDAAENLGPRIVAVADEFDSLLHGGATDRAPRAALALLTQSVETIDQPIVAALSLALRRGRRGVGGAVA